MHCLVMRKPAEITFAKMGITAGPGDLIPDRELRTVLGLLLQYKLVLDGVDYLNQKIKVQLL